MVKVESLERSFSYLGTRLPDPLTPAGTTQSRAPFQPMVARHSHTRRRLDMVFRVQACDSIETHSATYRDATYSAKEAASKGQRRSTGQGSET